MTQNVRTSPIPGPEYFSNPEWPNVLKVLYTDPECNQICDAFLQACSRRMPPDRGPLKYLFDTIYNTDVDRASKRGCTADGRSKISLHAPIVDGTGLIIGYASDPNAYNEMLEMVARSPDLEKTAQDLAVSALSSALEKSGNNDRVIEAAIGDLQAICTPQVDSVPTFAE